MEEKKGFEALIRHLKLLIKLGRIKAQFQFEDGTKLFVECKGRANSPIRYRIESEHMPSFTWIKDFLGDRVKLPKKRIKPRRMLRPVE
jgi:hypothetical protein